MKRSLTRQLKQSTDIVDTFTANPGKHILCMGAGVQSTAILLKFGHRYDHVIFADTGDEQLETYYHIKHHLKPYCRQHNINWITVKHKDYDSLSDYCIDKQWTPNVGRLRHSRRCTDHFKITPVLKQLKALGATKDNPINHHMGISIDESHRLNAYSYKDKPQYQHKVYPLIDHKISRKDCHKIIQDSGMPTPVKSGCDFCPFAGRKKVRDIAGKDPIRFKKILQVDGCDRRGGHLFPPHALTLSHTLGEYTDDDDDTSCDSGHCFT